MSAPTTRRTQAERRASTRAALLQATVDCLIELGYAGTTTSEVQQRAGLSRGALTHHFASKAELMLAAMDQLYDDISAVVRQAASELPATGRERVRPAVRLLWAGFNGPLFLATMELWMAARTDSELAASLLPHERRLGGQLRGLAQEVFGPELSAHPSAEAVYQLLSTSMRGQAMTFALQPGAMSRGPEGWTDPGEGPHLERWFELVEAFAAWDSGRIAGPDAVSGSKP
jgi:AcrR family transcriptional regulator